MTICESRIDTNALYFHGTKNKIDQVHSPSAYSPFFVCKDIDYAYSYSHVGQVNGKSCFQIKQDFPGYIYIIELNPRKVNMFNALDNNDISKLSKMYPKYLIENLKQKKWSIWSIFSYLNDYLFYYYSKRFRNVEQFKKYLQNKKFNDYFDNNLFFNGIKYLTDRYDDKYSIIYQNPHKWECLFKLIQEFNKDLMSLGYNSFMNRENVSRVNEDSDKVVTNNAIGIFDVECIKSVFPKAILPEKVKEVVQSFQRNRDYIGSKNFIQSINSTNESSDSNDRLSQYSIVELRGKDLEKAIPYIIPLITKSYEKIGGKQGERSAESLIAIQTLAQVVYDKGRIIAYSLAKKVHQDDVGDKINLIGCDQTWKGKEAMQAIIKYNIDNFKQKVWCECSGAIEHWFKKYNGYPISNQLAPEIIGEPRDKVWFHEDGYHYRRFLPAANNRFVQKILFGFANDDVMEKTLNQVGYDIMREKINSSIQEKQLGSSEKAIQFIQQLQKNVEDKTIDAMLPSIEKYLDKAIEILDAEQNEFAEAGRKIKKEIKPLECGTIKK